MNHKRRRPAKRPKHPPDSVGVVYEQPVMLVGWMHPTLAGTTVAVSGAGPFTPRRK